MTAELRQLLREVSRSFYLTLRILPGKIRPQIGLAYLLARATDTIADTRLVPVSRRLAALRELRDAIAAAAEGRPRPLPEFRDLASTAETAVGRGSAGERNLLLSFGTVLDVLRRLTNEDRQRIQELLATITSGQELDLERFGEASEAKIGALRSPAELDDYIYRVAGCVGEFWTKMCRAHLFPAAHLNDGFLLQSGVRFGKGLQLVNILRDLPGDLRQGRCYLPLEQLAERGLAPEALLNLRCMDTVFSLYEMYLRQAEDHLAAGWAYTTALPFHHVRVRLACAWPILIGMKTLARLRARHVLEAGEPVKVPRPEIRRLVLRSVVLYPVPPLWNRLFES